LSRRKLLTIAGSAYDKVSPYVYVRSYIPPVTDRLVQQLSPLAPQLVRPGPLVWQLAIVVEPPPLLEPPELEELTLGTPELGLPPDDPELPDPALADDPEPGPKPEVDGDPEVDPAPGPAAASVGEPPSSAPT
jgi:hypothetical protein